MNSNYVYETGLVNSTKTKTSFNPSLPRHISADPCVIRVSVEYYSDNPCLAPVAAVAVRQEVRVCRYIVDKEPLCPALSSKEPVPGSRDGDDSFLSQDLPL